MTLKEITEIQTTLPLSRTKSEARRAYWATQTPEQRRVRMSKMAHAKNKKMTTKQRREHALMMVKARNKK